MEKNNGFNFALNGISNVDVKEVVETDIVVVGAGSAGVVAALTGAEKEAKVVLLQKGPAPRTYGMMVGALGTKKQKAAGYKTKDAEVLDVVQEFCLSAGYRNDFDIVKLWADYSGETIDWISDLTGVEYDWMAAERDIPGNYFNQFATNISFRAGAFGWTGVFKELCKKLVPMGVDVRFNMPGIKLIRNNDSGRVTGVVAEDLANGGYIQFNATKGVILCTGDYAGNPEMVDKYCHNAYGFENKQFKTDNTGDGHIMAINVGGKLEKWPHAPVIHFQPPLVDAPFLIVNKDGNRFMNEFAPYERLANALVRQKGSVFTMIFDSDWEDKYKNKLRDGIFENFLPDGFAEREFKAREKEGLYFVADTLEELAEKLNIPVDNFVATVNRYNELSDKGIDEDYGKSPNLIKNSSIKNPPFIALVKMPLLLVTLGGMEVNTKLEVLDTDYTPIKGLYVAGNTCGNFYGTDYPMSHSGISIGRAVTFGRLAVKNAMGIC